jgi:hypothetical protein
MLSIPIVSALGPRQWPTLVELERKTGQQPIAANPLDEPCGAIFFRKMAPAQPITLTLAWNTLNLNVIWHDRITVNSPTIASDSLRQITGDNHFAKLLHSGLDIRSQSGVPMKINSKFFSLMICVFSVCVVLGELSYSQDSEEKSEDRKKEKVEQEKLAPSHKQVKVIRPDFAAQTEGKAEQDKKARKSMGSGPLKTFCLAYDGTILAGLSDQNDRHALQFLSPDGDLKQQLDLQFSPQVISQAPDGTIFIAGPGKLAKVSTAGKLLDSADAPWLGDPEEMKKEVIAQMEEQYQGIIENYQTTLESLEKRIKKIQSDLEEDPSERLEKRLAALEKQRKTQQTQIEALEKQLKESTTGNIEMLLSSRMRSTGIASNSKDLFVCTSGKNYSYEVWRMDHDFKSPEKVVKSLSGCCGQCDIQCDEKNLVVAANTEFAVQFRTREGKRVSKFGQRGGQEGFGSCCNPMNVKVLSNGDVLTAESSIGWIKRFNREGELEAVIGKAKIGGGCKHVPIGFNAELDRYYMLYEDRAEICVLDAISSLSGPTEDEIAAKKAQEGLGRKVVGKWKNSSKRSSGGSLRGLFGASNDQASALPNEIELRADGYLKIIGGQFGAMGERWEAVRQEDNVLAVQMVSEEDSGFGFEIKFISDEKAEFKLMMDVHEFGKATFNRVVDKQSDTADAKTDKAEAEESESAKPESEKQETKMIRIIRK